MFTEAELLAGWERVRDNNGCAGVDAVTVERFGTSAHTRLKRLQQAWTPASTGHCLRSKS